MKNRMECIKEFVESATKEELVEMIFWLYQGVQSGIAGMNGDDYTGVCKKPRTKKEAVERALRFLEVVKNSFWSKIEKKGVKV